jgi:hypothetical protein
MIDNPDEGSMQNQFTITGLIRIFCLPLILLFLCVQAIEVKAMTETKEKVTVGEVEEVTLLPWKTKLPARIDTGATRSCLDARDIRIDGGMVEFRLPEKYGGTLLRLPAKGRRSVRSAQGRVKRAFVEMEICIGTKRILTTVSLTDRSKMDYPLLIGRNVLANDFIVDVSKSYLLPPTCFTGTPK